MNCREVDVRSFGKHLRSPLLVWTHIQLELIIRKPWSRQHLHEYDSGVWDASTDRLIEKQFWSNKNALSFAHKELSVVGQFRPCQKKALSSGDLTPENTHSAQHDACTHPLRRTGKEAPIRTFCCRMNTCQSDSETSSYGAQTVEIIGAHSHTLRWDLCRLQLKFIVPESDWSELSTHHMMCALHHIHGQKEAMCQKSQLVFSLQTQLRTGQIHSSTQRNKIRSSKIRNSKAEKFESTFSQPKWMPKLLLRSDSELIQSKKERLCPNKNTYR